MKFTFTAFLLFFFLLNVSNAQNADSLKIFLDKYEKCISLWAYNKDTASRAFVIKINNLPLNSHIGGFSWDGVQINKCFLFKIPNTGCGGDSYSVELDSDYSVISTKTLEYIEFGDYIKCFIRYNYHINEIYIKDTLALYSTFVQKSFFKIFKIGHYEMKFYLDKGEIIYTTKKGSISHKEQKRIRNSAISKTYINPNFN